MAIPSTSSIPEKQISEYSEDKLMQPPYTNGATAHHRISPNIPAILRKFLPSNYLMSNQTHPALGNKGYILLNIASTQRETNFRVSSRTRDQRKRYLDQKKQLPVAAAAENITTLSTDAGENTSEVLLQIFDPSNFLILT